MTRYRVVPMMLVVLVAVIAVSQACGTRHPRLGRRVIVLGFDGVDYGLTRDLMARGRLPNFARLAAQGTFALSDVDSAAESVAWSNFITGLDPGGHGIFDFVHRDPKTMVPYLSTTKTEAGTRSIRIGRWQLPLAAGKVELLRHGAPFWRLLEDHGIDSTIVRMPANFPPSGEASRELSGMGTPDLLGTYGTFSFFTSGLIASGPAGSVSGGVIYQVDVVDDIGTGRARGARQSVSQGAREGARAVHGHRDASRRFVKLDDWLRGAAATRRRVERLGAYRVRTRPLTASSCRGQVLPETARSRF